MNNENYFRTLFEKAPLGYQSLDIKGNFVEVNEAWLDLLGYTKEEIINKSFADFLSQSGKDNFKKNFPRFKAAGEVKGVVFEMLHKDGSIVLVSMNGKIGKKPDGSFQQTHCILHDITADQKAEQALLESDTRFRDLMQQSPSVIELYDTDGLQIEVNKAYEKLWGFPASHTVNSFNVLKSKEVIESGLRPYLDRAYAGETVQVPVYKFDPTGDTEARGPGRVRWLSTRIYPLWNSNGQVRNIVITHEDVSDVKNAETKNRKLENHLRQAHKMEAIGTMAGGIAHDFNNILAIIIGNADMAIDDVSDGNPAKDNLRQILAASTRAKDLVKQILTFSRQTDQEMIPLQSCAFVTESLKLLRSTIPTTVHIEHKMDKNSGAIMADATQLHQLLMNLVSNAVHAMEEKGTLTIGCSCIELAQDSIPSHVDTKPGRYLKLCVSDTGPGIPQEIQDRMFDPFYTTKSVNEGTGMGLSIIMGIVQSHNGFVTVESSPGEGATFDAYFPAIAVSLVKADLLPNKLPRGNEHILFVDDETALAETGQKILEKQGYKVTIKTDSQEALEFFIDDPAAIDLVVTDQTMPKVSGAELTAKLLAIRPELPIILCTGFSTIISESKALKMGVKKFCMKPLDRIDLTASVRNVLDEANKN